LEEPVEALLKVIAAGLGKQAVKKPDSLLISTDGEGRAWTIDVNQEVTIP